MNNIAAAYGKADKHNRKVFINTWDVPVKRD